ncbi:hypothetical protein ACVBEQ_02960 [Nakamurella sp. GG22]
MGDGDAAPTDTIRLPLDPAKAVRSGTFDPLALLMLWALRCATITVVIAGLIYARVVTERFDVVPEISTPAQALRVLLTPFAGLAIAVALRFAVDIGALALAYPFSRRATGSAVGPDLRRPFLVWADRLHLVRAYRSLRWTTSVRAHAADRLGRWGRVLKMAGPALLIADIVLVLALVVVVLAAHSS